MKPEDILGLAIVGTWLGLLSLEALFPARPWPAVRGWRWLGALALLVYLAVGTILPLFIPAAWFGYALLDLSWLGPIGGTVVGYAALSLVGYVYHRACHRFDPLWRGLHQLHHSAPRLDIGGSMMFHPFEMAAYTLMQVGVLVLLLGLHPLAVVGVGYVGTFYALFQHTNVRTPRLLGYFIQRPEAHALHHAREIHAYNYGDLPIWDLLFGTFRNPESFDGEVGFGEGAHRRVLSMLVGHDVSAGSGTAVQQGSAAPVAAK